LAPAKNKQDSKNVDSKKKDKKKKKAGKISSDSFPSVNRSAQVRPEEVRLMSPAVLLSLLVCMCYLCATKPYRLCSVSLFCLQCLHNHLSWHDLLALCAPPPLA
jgi:hypothetical protein